MGVVFLEDAMNATLLDGMMLGFGYMIAVALVCIAAVALLILTGLGRLAWEHYKARKAGWEGDPAVREELRKQNDAAAQRARDNLH